ncbi:MAG: T9SS type A sorting domain-containing protein [Bacteroidales bacterium]|nr:T9SS type A sorting domain-containing protein [Bacteroidales bacterium]
MKTSKFSKRNPVDNISKFIIGYSLFIILLFPSLSLPAQTWTDPVNISNMPGYDNQPDLCIDKTGTLHCVFTHKLESNWRKIYYSKSTDDGQTWTTPEDISLNNELSLMEPHIVSDTNNHLYVTYDYNTGNPALTMIYLKTFNGTQWSEPFIVSEGMYNSDYNDTYIDNNNRLYVFWLYENQLMYYKYFENGVWSEAVCPYPGYHKWILISSVVDVLNNLHCAGVFLETSQPTSQSRVIYFTYDYLNNEWSDKTFISNATNTARGVDIDVNNINYPAITYRQRTYFSGQYNDSTMYTYFNGNSWSIPELVVNDPYYQKIVIDPYNRVHIIDREKLETGTKLVHYQKYNDLWQGYIIDSADNLVSMPNLQRNTNFLYLLYVYCADEYEGEILFTKYDIITNINPQMNIPVVTFMNVYPNPFKTTTTIEFKIEKAKQINLSIYNLNGKLIKTLKNEYTERGEYRLIWNGKGKNGKEGNSGLYLVRLQSGRKIITKAVEYIK